MDTIALTIAVETIQMQKIYNVLINKFCKFFKCQYREFHKNPHKTPKSPTHQLLSLAMILRREPNTHSGTII